MADFLLVSEGGQLVNACLAIKDATVRRRVVDLPRRCGERILVTRDRPPAPCFS